jgi:hypothetical protein
MRKLTVAAGLAALTVVSAALVLSVAERDAGAQRAPAQKIMWVSGTNANNAKVDSTAGAIATVTVKAHAGGGYALTIQAVAGRCTLAFNTAADAAEMAARVLDPKTTQVVCQGPVVTVPNFIPVNQVDVATDIAVTSGP